MVLYVKKTEIGYKKLGEHSIICFGNINELASLNWYSIISK
jgi:hypothetical protein